VKHGHVNRASDWAYSSIHQYISAGALDREWGGDMSDMKGMGEGGYGER
jgi:putative transposase